MIEIALTALTVVFVVVSAWLRTRWLLRDLKAKHSAELAQQRAQYELATRTLAYARWWARNAAETSLIDAHRSHIFRLALAALLAPDVEGLQRGLAAFVAQRTGPDGKVRGSCAVAAHLALTELRVAVRPWEEWATNPATANKPPHNMHAVGECFEAALEGWSRLIPTLRDESSEPPPGNSPSGASISE